MDNKKNKKDPNAKEKAIIQKFKRVFSGSEGEEVIKELMKKNFVLDSSFTSDPYRTAFNEGRRSLIMDILYILQIDEKKYFDLIEDSRDELLEDELI